MTVVSGLNMEYVCVYWGVICIAPCFYTAANFSNSCETIFFFLSLKLFFFLFLPTWGSYLITLLLLLLSRFSHVRLCVTPETAAHQAPPSLGFSRLLPINWGWHLRPIGLRWFPPKDPSRSNILWFYERDRQVLAADPEASRKNGENSFEGWGWLPTFLQCHRKPWRLIWENTNKRHK